MSERIDVSGWNEETDNIVGLHVVGKGLFKLVKGSVSKGEALRTQKQIKNFDYGYDTQSYKRNNGNNMYSVWQRILHEYDMHSDEELIGKYIHYTVNGIYNRYMTSKLTDIFTKKDGIYVAIVLDVNWNKKEIKIADNNFITPEWMWKDTMDIVKIEEVTKERRQTKGNKTKTERTERIEELKNENKTETYDLHKLIENKKKRTYRIRTTEKKLDALPSNMKFAIQLHNELCEHNHPDDCNWQYENNKLNAWDEPIHKKYLHLADKIQSTEIADDNIIAILKEEIEL